MICRIIIKSSHNFQYNTTRKIFVELKFRFNFCEPIKAFKNVLAFESL